MSGALPDKHSSPAFERSRLVALTCCNTGPDACQPYVAGREADDCSPLIKPGDTALTASLTSTKILCYTELILLNVCSVAPGDAMRRDTVSRASRRRQRWLPTRGATPTLPVPLTRDRAHPKSIAPASGGTAHTP